MTLVSSKLCILLSVTCLEVLLQLWDDIYSIKMLLWFILCSLIYFHFHLFPVPKHDVLCAHFSFRSQLKSIGIHLVETCTILRRLSFKSIHTEAAKTFCSSLCPIVEWEARIVGTPVKFNQWMQSNWGKESVSGVLVILLTGNHSHPFKVIIMFVGSVHLFEWVLITEHAQQSGVQKSAAKGLHSLYQNG